MKETCASMLESILEVFQAVEGLQARLFFWKGLVTNPTTPGPSSSCPMVGVTWRLGPYMRLGERLPPLGDPSG